MSTRCQNKECACEVKDCSICTGKTVLGYWTKEQWMELFEIIYWHEVKFLTFLLVVCPLILGWWGLPLALLIFQVANVCGAGICFHFPISDPQDPIPCSAGIKDCWYCGNGYEHAFNVYTYNNLKWYQKYL